MANGTNKTPEKVEMVVDTLGSYDYTGAKWRLATETEVDEIAQLEAEVYYSDSIRIGVEDPMDPTELFIKKSQLAKEKVDEYSGRIMVLDFSAIDKQIFHIYAIAIFCTPVTKSLSLDTGFYRVLKENGKYTYLEDDFDVLPL